MQVEIDGVRPQITPMDDNDTVAPRGMDEGRIQRLVNFLHPGSVRQISLLGNILAIIAATVLGSCCPSVPSSV